MRILAVFKFGTLVFHSNSRDELLIEFEGDPEFIRLI